MFDDDSEEKRRKDLFKKVARAIKEDPKNYVEKLAELGFTWVDDEIDEEAVEERAATIRNDNEKDLVSYFEGKTELSDEVLDAFLAEKSSDSPNYPLFRRYFKRVMTISSACCFMGLRSIPQISAFLVTLATTMNSVTCWET
jgi:phosphoribosyl-ATP pyrophosphohydrolase